MLLKMMQTPPPPPSIYLEPRESQDLIFIFAGVGVEADCSNGHLYRGKNGYAGEIGPHHG
jgi:predicted NBD/HSP70 family sugar kinase